MKIVDIKNYEKDNGIEVLIEENGEKYKAYLQYPETGDSEHAFLDGTKNDELLERIVNEVESKYSSRELNALTHFGYFADVNIREENGEEIFYTDFEEDGEYRISPYTVYYNVEVWEKL